MTKSKSLEQKGRTCLFQILRRKSRAGDNLFSVIHTSAYSFSQYKLNTYYMLDIVLGIMFIKMIETLSQPGSGDRHTYQKLQWHAVGTMKYI